MPDLLIRDLPEPLLAEILKAAANSGRSLSEESKHLIRKGLSARLERPEPGNSAWDELRNALDEAQLSDADHDERFAATVAFRQSGVRQTPEIQ